MKAEESANEGEGDTTAESLALGIVITVMRSDEAKLDEELVLLSGVCLLLLLLQCLHYEEPKALDCHNKGRLAGKRCCRPAQVGHVFGSFDGFALLCKRWQCAFALHALPSGRL